MLFLIVLVATLTAPTLAIDPALTEIRWEDYKAQFAKPYLQGSSEDESRKAIFECNLEKMRQHNRRFDAGLETYEMGFNQWTDLTPEQFLGMNSASPNAKKPEPVEPMELEVFVPELSPEEIKPSLNWVEKGAVTAVKDQVGNKCGSCFAFSAMVALEGQYFKRHGEVRQLSEKNCLDCARGSCESGGMPFSCMEMAMQKGVMFSEDYPYEPVKGECRFNASAELFKVSAQGIVSHEKDLLEAVQRFGPMSISLEAAELQMYSRGILSNTEACKRGPNHAVGLVGYGTDNGTDYYLMKNSWGDGWGEKGYFRVKRDIDYCFLTSLIIYAVL